MKRTQHHQTSWALLSLSLILLAANGLLAGCNPLSQLTVAPNIPTPTATPVPPVPHKTIVFCNDETPSYDGSLFHEAAQAVAGWIDQLVYPNQAGATIYVQYITSNSYSDAADYLTFDVPGLGPLPSVPGLEPTFARVNVNEQHTADAIASQTASVYNTASATFASQEETAQQEVKQNTDAIRKMAYGDTPNTDIWGCPQRATEEFSKAASGDSKYLVIASDMSTFGKQEHLQVDLHGVRVAVIFFQTRDVDANHAATTFWTNQLLAAGAVSVAFYRPHDQLPAQMFG